MSRSSPQIHAFVEVDGHVDGSWPQLPPQPWPTVVRLERSTCLSDVALVVAVGSSYGRNSETPATSGRDLVSDFPAILPGGLGVVAEDQQILPGCCCGLEAWRDWLNILPDGRAPWTGHDPAPLVEATSTVIRVWPDDVDCDHPGVAPIVFTRDEFEHALAAAADDLAGFLIPLESWLRTNTPSEATVLLAKFAENFVAR